MYFANSYIYIYNKGEIKMCQKVLISCRYGNGHYCMWGTYIVLIFHQKLGNLFNYWTQLLFSNKYGISNSGGFLEYVDSERNMLGALLYNQVYRYEY
jgi:hypothetical protein